MTFFRTIAVFTLLSLALLVCPTLGTASTGDRAVHNRALHQKSLRALHQKSLHIKKIKKLKTLKIRKGSPRHIKKAKKISQRHRVARIAPPEAILLKDLTTGQLLFEQHADQPMPPASLTKIMSALVILEEGNLEDLVTVSQRAASAGGTRLFLKAGQVLPLRGLLEAMLIRSANDACLAAAEHIGGDETAFVVKMNVTAKAIGLSRTKFQNACGFDMEAHYSTAKDLALLTTYAMANDTFASIVKEPDAVIYAVDQPEAFVVRTTNRLLGTVDGVVGVKTGYTRGAGRCLITVVRRDGKELLLVLLNARQRWSTAQSMIELWLR